MGRLREIPRTAAFAWSPSITRTLVATGTRAGAVDADFSDSTTLEIWDLALGSSSQGELSPIASVSTDSKFFDLAWGQSDKDHPEGIIAGALENGSLDLYDAAKLISGSSDALIARTSKHSGPIKALQFNPHRPELLATAGTKGELYITDLNNPENPYRVGASAPRADDFEALDWNKKVPHILVTGSSGGFVTVWDIKAKKESLTLNNYGRKPVSAVAWNPDEPTKLATAIPTDQDPLILLWNLRNSSAPEKILKGHDQGVLSLAWCAQDSDLLLSSGKDNRNICWNPHAAQMVGEFPIVLNAAFQTRWNPKHPSMLATASFDGKIVVQSIQNTNSKADDRSLAANQAVDGEDFFAKAQTQPQGSSFNLLTPPKWTKRPVGVSFGFGGRVVKFAASGEPATKSTMKISTFVSDTAVETSISEFQQAMKQADVSKMCESRIESSTTDAGKEDWRVIQTLVSESPRKKILAYLGFSEAVKKAEETSTNGEATEKNEEATLQTDAAKQNNRLSAFFDNNTENSNFLTDLAASKGARTNNPFHIFTGSESDVDKQITRALMLGSFEDALDICLQENRMSDAFMLAICGGQKCIDKAQTAYFQQQSNGPNYLRVLASIVGKNLWDVVYNADLENWKEVMATLCTYADESDFPDLCEALGDRLEESQPNRKNASFCYLAGSKLEKVVPIWINDMNDSESSRLGEAQDDSAFSIHVQSLQNFIEKVSIFRRATNYEDKSGRQEEGEWKLDPLYKRYAEYADVVAAHGHLDLAEEYVNLLPTGYPAAEVAKNRIAQALKKTGSTARAATRAQPSVAAPYGAPVAAPYGAPSTPAAVVATRQPVNSSYMPANPYAPAGGVSSYAPPAQNGPYAPMGGYQPPGQPFTPPPAASGPPTSAPPPPKAAANGANWNDLPDGLAPRPPRSGRGTPQPASVASPYASQPPNPYTVPARATPPLPPPPKAGAGPPRIASPLADQSSRSPPQRPSSSAANAYAPSQPAAPSSFASVPGLPNRSASPYNPPPAGAPASNRYAPAPAAPGQPVMSGPPPPGTRPPVAPNPYAAQPSAYAPQPSSQYAPAGQPPAATGPPPTGPPPAARGPPQGPPRTSSAAGAPRPPSATSQGPPAAAKHPPGDRSHIPADAQPIFEVLNSEMQRIKPRAPASQKQVVDDTEKRLNLLFDALNNGTLQPNTVNQLKELATAMQSKNFQQAEAVHTGLMTQSEQGGPWMVGVKRLVKMASMVPA